jgi:hypothetical protein
MDDYLVVFVADGYQNIGVNNGPGVNFKTRANEKGFLKSDYIDELFA